MLFPDPTLINACAVCEAEIVGDYQTPAVTGAFGGVVHVCDVISGRRHI